LFEDIGYILLIKFCLNHEIFKYLVLIFGLNLLPKEDRENKFNIVNNDEILRKKSKAGAKATGRKFNFPEKIKKHPRIIINEIIKYFL